MHLFLLSANGLIALCYYTIAALVGIQVWQRRKHGLNPLALATAGIFLTCALGHSVHVLSYEANEAPANADAFSSLRVPFSATPLLAASVLPQLVRFICDVAPSGAAARVATVLPTHANTLFSTLQLAVDIATVVPAAGFLALRRRYSLLVQGEAVILDYERRIATEQALVAQRTSDLAAAHAHAEALAAAHARAEHALAALHESERAMQEAQRLESLGVLAGGIAHDFNNILTSVLGHAELASLDAEPESSIHDAVQRIIAGANHAVDLTRQMLAYAGKGLFVLRQVSLSALVHEIAELLHISVGRNATIRYHLAEPLPHIEADVAQVRQVIMNLLTNAAEAIGPEGGTITVTTSAAVLPDHGPVPYVLLEVKDTGCGMTPDVQRRIFEPFYTTKFTGRGLGLAAVQGIVRSHHGHMNVCSAVGEGTSVRVWFPANKLCIAPPALLPAPIERSSGVVLIIDDEAPVRGVLASLVERLGLTSVLAPDGAAGLAALEDGIADLHAVLVDLTMPGMSGVDVARTIRSHCPATPVILMTGYSVEEVATRYSERPALPLLQKPCTLLALRDALFCAEKPLAPHVFENGVYPH